MNSFHQGYPYNSVFISVLYHKNTLWVTRFFSLSLHNQQSDNLIWFEMSSQRAQWVCREVRGGSWKYYVGPKSSMKAYAVEEEWGFLLYLSGFQCGILFFSWSQLEMKSVIGFDPCYTPEGTPQYTERSSNLKNLFHLETAWDLLCSGTDLSCLGTMNHQDGWDSEESPSCDFYYLE